MKRFFDKVNKTSTCWNWTGAIRGKSGYGCMKYNGKVINSYRISWMIHKGDIPIGSCICHTCDNRLCVNPDHLFLGTQSDNMIDAFMKSRIIVPIGGRFRNNHIPFNRTIIDITEIRRVKMLIRDRQCTLKQLSENLNLPYQLLRDINSGRIYKDE